MVFAEKLLFLFENYFKNRTIVVKINGCISDHMNVRFCAAQGSVTGSLSYFVNVNRVRYATKKCNCYMFADDTLDTLNHLNYLINLTAND